MLLQKAIIANYRNLENVTIPFERFSALIGPNNIGKSSILRALEYIFTPINARNLLMIALAGLFGPCK